MASPSGSSSLSMPVLLSRDGLLLQAARVLAIRTQASDTKPRAACTCPCLAPGWPAHVLLLGPRPTGTGTGTAMHRTTVSSSCVMMMVLWRAARAGRRITILFLALTPLVIVVKKVAGKACRLRTRTAVDWAASGVYHGVRGGIIVVGAALVVPAAATGIGIMSARATVVQVVIVALLLLVGLIPLVVVAVVMTVVVVMALALLRLLVGTRLMAMAMASGNSVVFVEDPIPIVFTAAGGGPVSSRCPTLLRPGQGEGRLRSGLQKQRRRRCGGNIQP